MKTEDWKVYITSSANGLSKKCKPRLSRFKDYALNYYGISPPHSQWPK